MSTNHNVAVLTGAAGGMGFASARLIGTRNPETIIVISDVNEQKLTAAVEMLHSEGINVHGVRCDVSNRTSVEQLAAQAAELGTIAAVIHAAGVSPSMTDAPRILDINALGTVYVTEAFLARATPGFVLVNVASMAAYSMPSFLIPTRSFKYSLSGDITTFARKLNGALWWASRKLKPGMAYSISKNFVTWYSKKMSKPFGQKGARIVSVSPGSFETDMGRLEADHGAAAMVEFAAIKRFGKVEEIAEVLAFCASDKPGYLTGVDILVDGGTIANITPADLAKLAK